MLVTIVTNYYGYYGNCSYNVAWNKCELLWLLITIVTNYYGYYGNTNRTFRTRTSFNSANNNVSILLDVNERNVKHIMTDIPKGTPKFDSAGLNYGW